MKKVSFLGNAFTYSLIISLFSIILAIVYYVFAVEIFSYSFMAFSFISSLVFIVGAMLFGLKNYRENALGGVISFGNAFLQAFAIGILGFIVVAIFNYIFHAWIAPEYAASQMDGFVNFMEGFGANIPDEAFDEAIADFEDKMTPIGQFKSALINGGVMSLITGLILAASIKKDTTQAEIS